MQRIITRAIAMAFLAAAATASAQAADFYGNIDMGVGHQQLNGKNITRVDNGNSSASIYGIRDTEDLGGGLKAIIQLEGSFKGDDGTQGAANTPFNRDTFAGLTNGTHTVKLGRLKTLNRAVVLEYDVFNASAWGIAMTAMDQNGNFAANSVQYDYNANGIKGSFQHTAGEQAGAGISGGSTDAIQARYATGPMSVTVTHTRVDDTAPTTASTTNTMVGASYDFGVVKTTVMYQNSNASKTAPVDSRFVVSAIAPLSSTVNVMAQAGQVKQANGDKATLVAVGGQYFLSKRTNLYASLSKSDLPNQDSKQLVAGIRHQF
jgi:predicted porin